MLREHAPLIAVSTVVAILFYLVFRDLRSVRSGLAATHAALTSLGERMAQPDGQDSAFLADAAQDADDDAEDDDLEPRVPNGPPKEPVGADTPQKQTVRRRVIRKD